MAIDTSTFETTLDNKIDAATTSDDAKSFLLLAKAVEAVNNAVSSAALSKSNNLSDLLNTTTALTNLGFTSTIAELNYTDGVTSNIQTQLNTKIGAASPAFTGVPTAPTAATGTNTTQVATTAFVQTEVTALVDSAPSTLNTLNELAAALGDDANFSTTVTNSIATKSPLSSPNFTGTVGIGNTTSSSFSSSANNLVVGSGSGSEGITIFGGAESNIFFSDGTSAPSIGRIEYSHIQDDMKFYVNNTHSMNITGGKVDIVGTLDIEEVYEKVTVQTSTTGTITFDTTVQAVELYTANQTANRTINFSNVNANLAIGQSLTVAIAMTQGSTAYYLNAYQIDGSSVTPKWSGGSAPTAGNASSIDSYSFTIIKTADATFTVLASQTQYA